MEFDDDNQPSEFHLDTQFNDLLNDDESYREFFNRKQTILNNLEQLENKKITVAQKKQIEEIKEALEEEESDF